MIGSQPTGTKSTAPAGQALWEKQESLYWKSTFMIWENGKRWVVVGNTLLELALHFYEGKLDVPGGIKMSKFASQSARTVLKNFV